MEFSSVKAIGSGMSGSRSIRSSHDLPALVARVQGTLGVLSTNSNPEVFSVIYQWVVSGHLRLGGLETLVDCLLFEEVVMIV